MDVFAKILGIVSKFKIKIIILLCEFISLFFKQIYKISRDRDNNLKRKKARNKKTVYNTNQTTKMSA